VEDFARAMALPRWDGLVRYCENGCGATPRRLADGAPRSSPVLVEVAGLPGATKSKTSDLTAMRDFEFRDEFLGVAARRFVALMTCGDGCRKSKGLRERFQTKSRDASHRPQSRFCH
jgi:hypothetical protein